jgi:hypothetical protein
MSSLFKEFVEADFFPPVAKTGRHKSSWHFAGKELGVAVRLSQDSKLSIFK